METGKRPPKEQARAYFAAVQRLGRAEPIQLKLQAPIALLVVADLQLALRHPGQTSDLSAMVSGFIRELIDELCHREPDLRPILELGWNPEYDQPVSEGKHPTRGP